MSRYSFGDREAMSRKSARRDVGGGGKDATVITRCSRFLAGMDSSYLLLSLHSASCVSIFLLPKGSNCILSRHLRKAEEEEEAQIISRGAAGRNRGAITSSSP